MECKLLVKPLLKELKQIVYDAIERQNDVDTEDLFELIEKYEEIIDGM